MATYQVETQLSRDDTSSALPPSLPLSPPPPPLSNPPVSVTLVAVASEDGQDVYAAPLLPGNELTTHTFLWAPLSFIGSPSTRITW